MRRTDMTAQSVRQSIPFTADLAAVRTFVGMRQQVAVKVALLKETCTANIALIRLFTIVHVHVLLQRV